MNVSSALTNFVGGTLTGGGLLADGGSVNIPNSGGVLTTNAANLGFDAAGASITVGGQNILTTLTTNAAAGYLIVYGGAAGSFTAAAGLSNAGTVNIGGTIFTTPGGFTQSGGSTAVAGTWNSSGTPAPVTINGGNLLDAGTIYGNVINGGTLTVGTGGSGGSQELSITGNYTQTSAGSLQVDIAGTTAGASTSGQGYGQLDVSGTASLNGTLQVSLANGYTPAAGNNYQLVTSSSSVSGAFSNDNLPAVSGATVTPSYGPKIVSLNVSLPVDTWTGGAAGDPNDWSDPNNWTLGVPTGTSSVMIPSGDSVVFPSAAGTTITSLDVEGTLTLDGGLGISGSGVIVNGVLSIGDTSGTNVGQLVFSGSGAQELGGSGAVVFGIDGNNNSIYANGGGPLTIGTGLTVHGSSGSIQGSGTVINQGTIDGDNSDGGPGGSTITIAPLSFTNLGSLEATGNAGLNAFSLTGGVGTATLIGTGASISFAGTDYVVNDPLSAGTGQGFAFYDFTRNTSTIAATDGGSIYLFGGTFTQADLGNLTADASSNVYLEATLTGGLALTRRHRVVATGRRRHRRRYVHGQRRRRADLHPQRRHPRRGDGGQ